MIQIKTIGGRVLYTAESAVDVRAALVAAVKEGADLQGAHLRDAHLQGADLQDADDPSSPLHAIRVDLWSILDAAPAEVPGLRDAIAGGRIDGSTYTGDCACLVGTIAHVRGVDGADGVLPGIVRDESRPAEQWFAPIKPGDVPADDLASVPADSEGVYRATAALSWLDEWTVSRTAIAAALAGVSS